MPSFVLLKQIQHKHKNLILFANVHVKRKQLIFHGILLAAGHHSGKKCK